MRVSRNSPALVVGALAAALAVGGCGRGEEPDLVNGKSLFIGKGTCGTCHTLARAGTKGTQGPNLDAAFGPARKTGLGAQTVEGVVYEQIGNVRRGSTMPEDLVKGKDARDVAAYVALVAGQPGKDTGELLTAGQPKVSNKPIAAKGGVLKMDAEPTGALRFISTKATAPAGALDLVSKNPSAVDHNIAIKGAGIDKKGPVVKNGGTSKVAASVKGGKYTFYCSVPGHEEGGMKGDLTVK